MPLGEECVTHIGGSKSNSSVKTVAKLPFYLPFGPFYLLSGWVTVSRALVLDRGEIYKHGAGGELRRSKQL